MTQEADVPCVYIVDDDEAVRDSVSLLLDSVCITNRSYDGAQALLTTYTRGDEVTAPGVIVLDIRMPQMNGLDCQTRLNELGCTLPIIFITGHGDVPMAVEAMKRGAAEFVQKPFRDQDLLDRIQYHLQASKKQVEEAFEVSRIKGKLNSLTAREKEVLDRVVQGKPNKVIALDLNVSQRTVEIHRANVMDKMAAKSLAELVKMVVQCESL